MGARKENRKGREEEGAEREGCSSEEQGFGGWAVATIQGPPVQCWPVLCRAVAKILVGLGNERQGQDLFDGFAAGDMQVGD
jgi:hypothetical protein